ncbi:MAG TPA: hypothetical protein P5287_01220 [bacterium]|nr:hypothetical protein [bacterium]
MVDDDMDDEFVEYDAGMGSGVAKCPECGAKVPHSVLLDEEAECPNCGEKISLDADGADYEDEDDDDDDDDDRDGDEEDGDEE